MKPRFRIGDYVEVSATVRTARTYQDPEHEHEGYPGPSHCRKVLRRDELPKAIRGWVVGAVRRFEGRIKGYRSDDEQPYLKCEKSTLLWKVAQSMTNVPVEAYDADVVLVAKPNNWTHQYLNKEHEWELIPSTPMRLGTPWREEKQLRAEMSQELKAWPRDSKGRLLKKERR